MRERPLTSIGNGGRRADQITEALKRYILVNQLAPGTRLPPERRLADALMAGRNAVREALHSLAILGIVEKRHGSGIYVRDFDAERLADQLSYGLREDAEYLRHLLEARLTMETMIVSLGAQRITDAQLAWLHELFDAMRRQFEQEQSLARTDRAFHLELAGIAGNPVLERLARAVIAEYFHYASTLRLDRQLVADLDTIQNHEPLLAALATRDAAASVEAMRFHFRRLKAFIDEAVEKATPAQPTTPLGP